MHLKLYRNARELWTETSSALAEKECILSTSLGHAHSLADLQKIQFPVVVRTSVDYESLGPSTLHIVLTLQEVEKIKREVIDMVISPYLDIIQKRGQ